MTSFFSKYFSRVKDELHIPGAVLSIDLNPNLVQSLSLSLLTQFPIFFTCYFHFFTRFPTSLPHHHHSTNPNVAASAAADQKFICKLKPRLKSPPSKQAACTNKLFKIETFKAFSDSQICFWPSHQMATYQNEAILIKAPELPLKHIEIAPQIKGEILKAGAEVFLARWQLF